MDVDPVFVGHISYWKVGSLLVCSDHFLYIRHDLCGSLHLFTFFAVFSVHLILHVNKALYMLVKGRY